MHFVLVYVDTRDLVSALILVYVDTHDLVNALILVYVDTHDLVSALILVYVDTHDLVSALKYGLNLSPFICIQNHISEYFYIRIYLVNN